MSCLLSSRQKIHKFSQNKREDFCTSTGAHGPSGDQATLDELVGVLPHDLTILAGSGLTLIGIHHKVLGPNDGQGEQA